MSEYPQYPQPKKKTNPWPWIALGCGVLFFGLIAFVGFIFTVVGGSMRSSVPYREATDRAQRDDRVAAALGTPIETGYFTSGSISVNNDAGNVDLSIPIHGPKGKAKIHVVGTKEGGRWSYSRMMVTPQTGEPIDLLRAELLDKAPPGA
jgi:hypothetical protein